VKRKEERAAVQLSTGMLESLDLVQQQRRNNNNNRWLQQPRCSLVLLLLLLLHHNNNNNNREDMDLVHQQQHNNKVLLLLLLFLLPRGRSLARLHRLRAWVDSLVQMYSVICLSFICVILSCFFVFLDCNAESNILSEN
jgi:hypothetical protein